VNKFPDIHHAGSPGMGFQLSSAELAAITHHHRTS